MESFALYCCAWLFLCIHCTFTCKQYVLVTHLKLGMVVILKKMTAADFEGRGKKTVCTCHGERPAWLTAVREGLLDFFYCDVTIQFICMLPLWWVTHIISLDGAERLKDDR